MPAPRLDRVDARESVEQQAHSVPRDRHVLPVREGDEVNAAGGATREERRRDPSRVLALTDGVLKECPPKGALIAGVMESALVNTLVYPLT